MSEFITHSDLAYATDNSDLKKEIKDLKSKINKLMFSYVTVPDVEAELSKYMNGYSKLSPELSGALNQGFRAGFACYADELKRLNS